MIILSGLLVVAAIGLLVAGIVAGNGDNAQVFGQFDALYVIYLSIAVSVVAALCLAIGVFLRRRELFGPGVAAPPARKRGTSKKDRRAKSTPPAPGVYVPAETKVPALGPADDETTPLAPAVDVPPDALVFVVRGRRRYHLDTCRQLAGRETEELTHAEATEEGFSPCTACMPDTALAARAAASAPASTDAGRAAGAGTTPPRPGGERSGGGLAGLAHPAPTGPKPDRSPGSEPSQDVRAWPATGQPAGTFESTAEIPRTDQHAAPKPATPPPSPAGPTLTDMPVAGLVAPQKTGPAGKEPDDASAPEPAESRDSGAGDAAASKAGEREPTPDAAEPTAKPVTEPTAKPVTEPTAKPATESVAKPAAESAAVPTSEPADEDLQVRILSGTKRYHRVDCALIADIGDEADDLEGLSRAEAKARGCTPCLVCQPDREPAR
ncbi:hypothetical protein BZB76_3013 [Actinomadura pelletieri DSM 43383]|uniref:Uncharacterized protein n=1 Tax=Actinomadura pelletieri DSM 43383 TaxID=1120940 RepID=A0A495QNK0_9ACTN|nr:hypothetical protein [Actinomadura pelletieri]RKS74499.1 hypothetical protein BZB76_3013 [Actinomadura pelletieri DSM 43383]